MGAWQFETAAVITVLWFGANHNIFPIVTHMGTIFPKVFFKNCKICRRGTMNTGQYTFGGRASPTINSLVALESLTAGYHGLGLASYLEDLWREHWNKSN